jgi:hypothetical protein
MIIPELTVWLFLVAILIAYFGVVCMFLAFRSLDNDVRQLRGRVEAQTLISSHRGDATSTAIRNAAPKPEWERRQVIPREDTGERTQVIRPAVGYAPLPERPVFAEELEREIATGQFPKVVIDSEIVPEKPKPKRTRTKPKVIENASND